MRLSAATSYFNRLNLYDGYDGTLLGKGQFDLYAEVTEDTPNIQRRVLEINPPSTLPARGVVTAAAGYRWVMGGFSHPDYFNDETIRRKFVTHRAHGLAERSRPEAYLANTTTTTLYAGLTYERAEVRNEFGTDNYPIYRAYLSMNEPLFIGEILAFPDLQFRVNNTYLSEAGFVVAELDQLTAGVVHIAVSETGTYDPITDTRGGTTNYYPSVVFVAWQGYEHPNPGSQEVRPGDLMALISKTDMTGITAGTKVTIGAIDYRVLGVGEEWDCWKIRLRP